VRQGKWKDGREKGRNRERKGEIRRQIKITGVSKLKGESGRMNMRRGGTEREKVKSKQKWR
jgi:hypothetical protein